jgi:hypothetical protein
MRSEPVTPVLVDLASAAAVPSDADIRDFLMSERVFISSVMATLVKERTAVATAIRELGAEPIWFEEFGGRDADPEAAYLAEVRSSTIYVGILGTHYGRILPSRFSATHEEYREAEHGGLRISVWTVADKNWDGDQERFVQEVRTFHVTGSFTNPDSLAQGVTQRLRKIAAEELSPWVKLGNLIFRASEIVVSSNRLRLVTHVRDAEIADALEGLSSGTWGGHEVQFTDPSRSVQARVGEVSSTARTGRGREIELTAEIVGGTSRTGFDFSLQTQGRTFTPNDLTELALREHLFGEINPAESGFASLPNPLGALPPGIPEDALRPIVRLFFIEALVGSGRASRLVTLRLGVPIAGRRRILIEWRGSASYSNPPQQRSVEGEVSL